MHVFILTSESTGRVIDVFDTIEAVQEYADGIAKEWHWHSLEWRGNDGYAVPDNGGRDVRMFTAALYRVKGCA